MATTGRCQGRDHDHGIVGEVDPAAVLVLVQSRALGREQASPAVVGDDEGKHAVKRHGDELVVADGVPSIRVGMAVHLGDEPEAGPAGGAAGGGDRVLVYEHAAAMMVSRHHDDREHEGVRTDGAPDPEDQTLVRLVLVAAGLQRRTAWGQDLFGDQQLPDGGPVGSYGAGAKVRHDIPGLTARCKAIWLSISARVSPLV